MGEPREVALGPSSVTITWDDEHRSVYASRFLRGQCRCAGCVEEMSGRRRVFEKDVPEDVRALDWLQVGRYALQFLWSDGHMTGIYPFDVLRALCPCAQCHAEKQ